MQMLRLLQQTLRFESLQKTCTRSMGKMDQFKWKRPKLRRNLNPRLSVILKEDYEKLGQAGQLVPVKRGYARNFLVPKGIAAYATRENMRKYLREDAVENVDSKPQICPKFMAFLERTNLKIKRKPNEFFEVNEHQIALEYKRQYQLHVPVNCITFQEPIRSYGEYLVNIAIKEGIVVPMKVSVGEKVPKDLSAEEEKRQLKI